MLTLIVLIVVCVMISNKAAKAGVSAGPYIVGSIFLGIVPSLILHLITGSSTGVAFVSAFLTIFLCLIPYNIVSRKAAYSDNEDESIAEEL